MRLALAAVLAAGLLALGAAAWGAAPRSANCAGAVVRMSAPLRFGIDAGLAGSPGATQLRAVPDDPRRDLAAARALRPSGRVLVVRLNRLFWSGGARLLHRFRARVRAYARAGLDVELQVRYHPRPDQVGHLAAWRAYVRHVVDVFGGEPRVVAMTITNEVNVGFSPNTSDGAFAGSRQALIEGIEAAHREARRRGFRRLRFGFTYAYGLTPATDTQFFAYLGRHGGRAFRRALGFVGLDFYPGSIYPPAASVRTAAGYRAATVQALGRLRGCLMVRAGLGRRVPIWVTENGVPGAGRAGVFSERRQAAALTALVRTVHAYAGTFNVTDYRWFNLRDSAPAPAGAPAGLFGSDGLLRSDYTRKPAFGVYRRLIATFGA